MSFKRSKYNILLRVDKKRYILYNSLYGSLITIPNNKIELVRKLLTDNAIIHKETLWNLLKENSFIIAREIDEYKIIADKYDKTIQQSNVLMLQILMNLDCNFSCDYCFEKLTGEYLLGENLQKVQNFLDSRSKEQECANVTWMGGEPLLSWREIEVLSKSLKKFKRFNAKIITNGFLFNDKIIHSLEDNCISGIFITIDGDPHMHNKRRTCKSNEDAYNVIKRNIGKILERFDTNVKITININLDFENLSHVKQMLNDYKTFKNSVNFSISRTVRIDSPELEIPEKHFLNIQSDIYQELTNCKVFNNEMFIPERRPFGCFNECNNGFTITPSAQIYKCISEIEDKKPFGTIDNNGSISTNTNNSFWLKYNLLERNDCKSCNYLPICMGGCPKKISKIECKMNKLRYNNRLKLSI
ncbi:MAG: SPASM domain-containing protein [Salinivirgaceae bacterium]|nr:SPASM domain-containing protein [Salinivirgaceae bacterium]